MASKINSLSGAPTTVGAGRPVEPARDATSGGGPGSAGSMPGDVHITDSANLLASLAQQLRNMPAVNEARVAQFRTAIASGSYTVQSGHVADQLMQIEHSLAQISGG